MRSPEAGHSRLQALTKSTSYKIYANNLAELTYFLKNLQRRDAVVDISAQQRRWHIFEKLRWERSRARRLSGRKRYRTRKPAGVILADAGYGADGDFRSGLSQLGLDYVVGVQPTLSVWRPGEEPLPPKAWGRSGRAPSLMRRSSDHKPLSAKALAQELQADAWRSVTWREGSNIDLASRFAAVRVRLASRDYNLTQPRAEEWLLIEWPDGDAEPLKYWLSTPPAYRPLSDLAATAKLRWRIERDYQELKQELGLGHYEGRGWRGFTTTLPSASRPTGSSSPSGRRFPPRHRLAPRTARNLPFPAVHDPAYPPTRPERHVQSSIATIRRQITAALVSSLLRCPCCARANVRPQPVL